ncbi:serine kinase [Rhodanobacter sp. DHG33]|uniref:DUF7336 domain-containing protein n=1 Tax=Rhodanobacter sp. DHG33 TaxID=2775921 RepID=UPI00178146E9|nr:serine kinase [Rhodanobacter sp. DHG33]MBD8900589.1 serine kinase [Rhodanobacter sp. DHG33]
METVFLVQHSRVLPSGTEDVKIIGVYRTLDTAKAAIQRLETQPGFAKHPNIIDPGVAAEESGFYIGEYELDRDHWVDGFVTLAGDREV